MSQNSTKKIIVASLSNFLTAAAIVAAGSGLSLWQDYLKFDQDGIGWLSSLSANCLSAAIGSFFGGILADRYGRKNVFSFAMLAFLLGIGLTATSTTFGQLLTGFIITGIAAGATVPASWSYICEASEPAHRGRNMVISQFAWGFGAAAVMWISTANAPGSYMFEVVRSLAEMWGVPSNHTAQVNVFGTRLIFGIIYVIAFVTWILQRQLDEAEEWKHEAEEHNGKGTSMKRAFTHIFGPKYIKPIVCITTMYLAWNMVASLMGTFQSNIYENIGEMGKILADRFNVWQWVLTCALTFWGIFIIDKWNHKKIFISFVSCGVLAWLLVALLGISSIPSLIIITILWAAQAGLSVQLFFALWGTEIFPTKYRATAIGLMFCIVRAVCTLGNIGFTSLWGKEVSNTLFTVSSIVMLFFMIVAAAIGYYYAPDTRGKSLDEITHERYDK